MKWLTYGKTSKNFFIKKIKSKNENLTDWDNDFIIQLSLLPQNLITLKNAQKILFIGKAMRILIKEDQLLTRGIKFITD